MSTHSTAAAPAKDWLSQAWLIPSWVLSLFLHAALLIGLSTWMEYSRVEPVGFTDEPSREFGIVLKSSGRAVQDSASTQPTETIDPPPVESVPAPPVTRPSSVASPASPTDHGTPTATPFPAIGAGNAFAEAATDPRERIKPGTAQTASAALGSAMPGAAFMGARDNGTRVVFVIDCSASMNNHGAMRSAKAALVSSLQSLAETQQFQIIFYNQTPRLLSPANGKSSVLMFATELNKTLARQQISGTEPDLGTAHIPALELALRLNPEVMFFLTDADQPQMTAQELSSIQKLNSGRTRIHAIEFGEGGEVDVENFLKKLARQNGGTYRYFDVKRLSQE